MSTGSRSEDGVEHTKRAVTGRPKLGEFDIDIDLAWTLLLLIETGPNPVITTEQEPDAKEWHHTLWMRAVAGGLVALTKAQEQPARFLERSVD
ncbi:hypothetical protein [Nocardia sp. NPDC056000]|uniref:hypothetical protein n=1 Tax=Nocardia sp. NPDC056000 TaxID=3345674 RepID=UPI0035DA7082